ncbi:MAG: glycosyltransferase [Limimaricola sp.]|uniref:glycosyltransferase family 2 protein n=1 Tax=Limimaricola sp. TaxID=2211665 RepID=UPI001D71155A|nr:glycosyltransferase [Limimaricola sp.]MBI1417157.1 glycosyltransferase [Limimaricola sp.]
MTAAPVSVIVVSRDRPKALTLCLKALEGQLYDPFEVVVVADAAGRRALAAQGWDDRVRLIPCDEANISVARNLGLAAAGGEIVAFIDDDAVAEPTWLAHLVSAFSEPDIAAAGGFVRGRKGIGFQWTARAVDAEGNHDPLVVDPARVSCPDPGPGRAVRTEGTNMAFRRDVLATIGGFDPAFRFYLDETDVNLRLAAAGHRTAIVPLAQVVHGFAAGPFRRADRVPRDLFQIGASLAVFLRKHAPAADHAARLLDEAVAQRKRLVSHFLAGRINRREVNRLMETFQTGWDEGQTREFGQTPPLGPGAEFQPFKRLPRSGRALVFSGRPWQRRARLADAARAAQEGDTVSVIILSPTARPHWVRFHPDGFWLQTGGLFGRSERNGPRFRFWRFGARVAAEVQRMSRIRDFARE